MSQHSGGSVGISEGQRVHQQCSGGEYIKDVVRSTGVTEGEGMACNFFAKRLGWCCMENRRGPRGEPAASGDK